MTLLQDGEIHLVDDGDEEKEISDGTYSWKELKKELFRKNTGHYVIFWKVLTKSRGMSFIPYDGVGKRT
ncbi:MAG: hypothetical protein ACLUGJ_11165 [Blautia wexlerae]